MVYDKGAPLDNCWRFVDGAVRAISRPGIHQRVLYNGHKRYHALKFQSFVAPMVLLQIYMDQLKAKDITVACSWTEAF